MVSSESSAPQPTPTPTKAAQRASAVSTPSEQPQPAASASPTASSPPQPAFRQGGHKSCDACKARKVKCPNTDYPAPCGNCVRRKEVCCFGKKKVPRRNVTKHLRFTRSYNAGVDGPSPVEEALRYVDEPTPACASQEVNACAEALVLPVNQSSPGKTQPAAVPAVPTLYVDHLLAQANHTSGKDKDKDGPAGLPGKVNSIFGGSYSLTYFSESRLRSLSTRLRNHKVDELVRRINAQVRQRLRRPADAPGADASAVKSVEPVTVDDDFSTACIRAYFERLHPLLPFLDRTAFEARVKNGDHNKSPSGTQKAWSALYHSVLAIGCAYLDNSSNPAATNETNGFEPGTSTAWRLFSRGALAHFADLLILPEDSLLALQALTAMSVYGLGVACLSIERVILGEAARRAQALAQTAATSSPTFQRTFWVLYGIEKVTSFHFGRGSTFVDTDIACPLPSSVETCVPLSSTWLVLSIRHARLLSRTYASLFSVGSACNTTAHSLATVDQLHAEIEQWRLSIPSDRGLRPEKEASSPLSQSMTSSPGLRSSDPSERTMTLALRYMYHSLVLILSRAKLHHLAQVPAAEGTDATSAARKSAQHALVVAARAILALTPMVDVEPYTPLWMLAVVPLMSLLVLFDVVVHSPTDQDSEAETGLNLVLLDMGAGYFSRIEYASAGSLPGSLLSEFAHIARDYINDCQRRPRQTSSSSTDAKNTPIVPVVQQPPPPAQPPVSQPLLVPTVPSQSLEMVDTTPTTLPLQWPIVDGVGVSDQPSALKETETDLPPGGLNLITTTADTATFGGSLVLNADGTASSVNSDAYLNAGYWNGNTGGCGGDLAGTDVMGLFTSNYYFLPEMDGLLFGNNYM